MYIIKIINKTIILVVILCLFNTNSNAKGFLKVQGKTIVDSLNNNILLRGFGLGGWMLQEGYMLQTESFANPQYQIRQKIEALIGTQNTDDFYEAWRANHCRKIDVDSLAAWGFNSIRLPMHYNLFTLPIEEEPITGQNTWLETGFTMVDNLLQWCKQNEMYLILDLHAAPGGQGHDQAISDYNPAKPSLWESAENRAKTVALWRKIAERYANESWIGGYDLINETNWDLPGNGLLKNLYQNITSAIREVDNNHIIFIEGNWFANDFTGLTPPWDANMVYSFHKYWSYNNTGSIQWMLTLRNNYNRPIWCGESGENSNPWFTDAITLFESNNIGWAWWPMKKIGSISGPLSIKKTEGYQRLLDYWEGRAGKPSSDYARIALMELTENLKFENCDYNKDVIDAMIRQVQTNETKAFAPNNIPGNINTPDYDLGKNGVAYYDTDIADYHVSTGTWTGWNSGWAYRNDGVDIESSGDNSGFEYSVGWTKDNEWLLYTVNVTKTDSFNIKLRIASLNGGGNIKMEIDNQVVFSSVSISSTGGWSNWQSLEIGNTHITAGRHTLKIQILKAGFNINQIQFTALNTEPGINVKDVELYQNFPNPPSPFSPFTNISFRLSKGGRTNITLFNSAGEKVKTIMNEMKEAGFHSFEFLAEDLASGVYFYKINTKNASQTRKLVIIR